MSIRAEPFALHVADSILDDLKDRLRRTRWPVEPAAAPWEHGASLEYMQRVAAYWADEFDWRRSEAAINRFSHYRSRVDGLDVHFILEPGSGKNPRPLILTHGWPGSFIEFLGVIEPLAHPERFGGREEDAFTVVVPSLPGFAFSQAPRAPITLREVARMWRNLMVDHLGFATFFAQGGDMGSILSSWLAFDHPEHVAALHLNSITFLALPEAELQTPEEREWLARNTAWRLPEDGYRTQQGTRPQTLAYGLTDSPVGLAAWILEKFHGWTVPGETRDPPFELDELLANVMLYWIAGPNPASWYYVSFFKEGPRRFPDGRRVTVPTGALLCPHDTVLLPPDSVIRRSFNLVQRTDAVGGGHFPALEQPALFIEEVRSFFRPYR
ncbi:MAG TPA: epoxide hydrolase [Ramlibacter sp.]|nr:epoxide hydrolase [Ramlibacter sp.]